MKNGKLTREQLAIEVQAEALKPTPPVNGASIQDRLIAAWQRIRQLEERLDQLRQQKLANYTQYRRELAKQRRELGINDEPISANAAQPVTGSVVPAPATGRQ